MRSKRLLITFLVFYNHVHFVLLSINQQIQQHKHLNAYLDITP